MKLVVRSVKIFWEKTKQKILWLECPFDASATYSCCSRSRCLKSCDKFPIFRRFKVWIVPAFLFLLSLELISQLRRLRRACSGVTLHYRFPKRIRKWRMLKSVSKKQGGRRSTEIYCFTWHLMCLSIGWEIFVMLLSVICDFRGWGFTLFFCVMLVGKS